MAKKTTNKKVERRGRPKKNPSEVKVKVKGRGRGRPKLDPSQLKNEVKVKTPGRGRGRPPMDPSKRKSIKKTSGKRGRPTGSLNKINFFKDNTTHPHLRMWEMGILKELLNNRKIEIDTIKVMLSEYKITHPEFYKENYEINGQKINIYEDLIEYMVGIGFIDYSRRTKLYSYSENYKMK